VRFFGAPHSSILLFRPHRAFALRWWLSPFDRGISRSRPVPPLSSLGYLYRPGFRPRPKKKKIMAYVPFTNDYSSLRTPAYVAAELAHRTAVQSRVNDIFVNGNAVMGGLIADCCSDPAFAGQGFYDDSTGAFGTLGSTATDPMAVLPAPGSYPLTPVDILTGTYGFPVRADGRPWPRPRLPGSYRRAEINAFPNIGPLEVEGLVPPCPCFSSARPIPIPVPALVRPAPAALAPAPAAPVKNCPYPACSTGNVCLDLVTGCVSNSQVTQAQVQACTEAGYSTFGNSGSWLSAILLGCGGNLPNLGTPLPNPPPATGDMNYTLQKANATGVAASRSARGVSGLGQVDPSNVGGFLAILGLFGIVVWANRK